MPQAILIVLIMLTSLPAGLLLAYLCRDELVAGRKWFKIISVVSIIAAILLLLVNINYKLEIILSLIYFAVVSAISLKLSFKKGFIK